MTDVAPAITVLPVITIVFVTDVAPAITVLPVNNVAPETVKLLLKVVFPAIYVLPVTPIPPATIRAPLVELVDGVAFVIARLPTQPLLFI